MKAQNGGISFLQFVCHPAYNPFLSLLWERAKRNPEIFLRRQFIALSIMLVGSLFGLVVMELLKVNPLLRGAWLLDAVVFCHIIAALAYQPTELAPLDQFWRTTNRHDLLLTGTRSIWLVLARYFCDFLFSAHFSILCLPFYAAAFALGVPIDAILLPLALVTVLSPNLAFFLGFWSWMFWFLMSLITYQRMGLPLTIIPLWVNAPFLLQQPVKVFVWRLPSWLVAFSALLLLGIVLAAGSAWSLEPRLTPSQRQVRIWLALSGSALAVLIGGVAWAYLPVNYTAKVALSLCALRLMISFNLHDMATITKEHPERAWKPLTAFKRVLILDSLVLAWCALIG